jgi:hypothetical protein
MRTDIETVRAGLESLAIFPLPSAVLLPYEVLPLHVFEHRYRRMIADVLDGGRPLAIAQLAPGWEGEYEGRPPVEALCGAGVVTRHERLADGRYNILLRGACRVRIEAELENGKAYREVRASLVKDSPLAPAADLLEETESLRRMLFALCASRPGPAANALAHLGAQAGDPGALADIVAAAVLTDTPRRRVALLQTDVARRLQLAQAAVAELLVSAAPPKETPYRN